MARKKKKRQKRKGKGSLKGGAFEREMSVRLSLWWTNDEDEDIFWRTAMSGGRATVRAKKGKKTRASYGDLKPLDKTGRRFTEVVTVSLKTGYNATSLTDVIDDSGLYSTPEFGVWIHELAREARFADTFGWMLIHKRNRKNPLVFLSYNVYRELMQAGAEDLKTIRPQVQFMCRIRKVIRNKKVLSLARNVTVWGTTLESFLASVERKHFIRVAKQWEKDKQR